MGTRPEPVLCCLFHLTRPRKHQEVHANVFFQKQPLMNESRPLLLSVVPLHRQLIAQFTKIRFSFIHVVRFFWRFTFFLRVPVLQWGHVLSRTQLPSSSKRTLLSLSPCEAKKTCKSPCQKVLSLSLD